MLVHSTVSSIKFAFSIYKKFRKISTGNFRLGRACLFVTSCIRGSRRRPGPLKDHERYGTGDDKDEKSFNGTQISIGKFPPGKRDYLFRNSGNSSGTSQKVVLHLHPNWNFGIFW